MVHIKDIYELETRREIYNFILKYPSLHIRELSRKLFIPKSTLVYHLNYLKKNDLLYSVKKNGYTRFYVSKSINKYNKNILYVLREEVPRKIIIFLLRWPNSTLLKISKHLHKHQTTVKFHLKKLTNIDIIEVYGKGRAKRYWIKNHHELYEILITFKDSLFDDTIDLLLEWLEKWHDDKDHIEKMKEVCCDIFPHPYYV